MKTYMAKKDEIERNFYVADADSKVLGRLATRIATILSGKHKPCYTPHVDLGDYVIVLNADKVRLTGKKALVKTYARYSGYPGGYKEVPFATMQSRKPKEIVRLAVKRMLPKNRLGTKMLRKLKLYTTSENPSVPKGAKEIRV